MKQFLTFTVLTALLYCLTGCAQYWYQEGKTYEECAADLEECQGEMLKYADANSMSFGGYEIRFVEQCMKEKGYKSVTEDKLPLRVKRKDPPKWFYHGIAGALKE